MGFRTMRITADSLFALIQALSTGDHVRIIDDPIPPGAALAKVSYDENERAFELTIVHHRWPDDAEPEMRPMWVRRLGNAKEGTAWSAATDLEHTR